jgi:HSP20 family molecular chaperone IbpA
MNQVANIPFLHEDEDVILSHQGLLKENLRSGWKRGRLLLTTKRVVLFQPPTVTFQLSLDDIVSLSIEKKAVILRGRNVLSIAYRKLRPNAAIEHNRNRLLKAWIAIDAVDRWRRNVYERSLLMINDDIIDRIAHELDPDSRAILVYVWQNRHARIEQLAELIQSSTHMDVLLRIKEHINPAAERVIGSAILSFEKARFDPETGEKVLFNWWTLGRREGEEQNRVSFDVFDDGSHLSVVMDLPGVGADDILLELDKRKLTVSAASVCKTFHQEIHLPAEVDGHEINKTFNNNVLVIGLKKAPFPILKEG